MLATKLDFENKQSLENILSQLREEFIVRSVPAADPSTASVEIFASLSGEQQKSILTNLSTYVEILAQETNKGANTVDLEKARLKAAMKRFELKPANDDVFEVIEKDQVIELYNLQGIQLYRNMYFFKLCSYNLLDLSVNAWDKLYDRPKYAMEATYQAIERLFTSGDAPIPYGIPTYLQKERYEYAGSLKTVEATPNYLVPLFSAVSGEPAGAFNTCSGRVIAEGLQSSRFRTLR